MVRIPVVVVVVIVVRVRVVLDLRIGETALVVVGMCTRRRATSPNIATACGTIVGGAAAGVGILHGRRCVGGGVGVATLAQRRGGTAAAAARRVRFDRVIVVGRVWLFVVCGIGKNMI